MSNSRFVLDLQDIEWEENIKSVGLATIFKMGTATSGNYGHAGRPGYVGGSVPRRSYVSWDNLDKPTPEQTTLFNDKPKVKAKPRVVVCEEGTIPEGTLKKWKEEVRRWPADEEHDPRAQKRWVADTAIDAADNALTAVTIKNGSLMGIMSFDVSESSVYVADLATKTRGYGTDLIMKAITKAADKNIPVKLFALSDAVPFYKKLGFVYSDGLMDGSGGAMTLSAHRCKTLVANRKSYWADFWKDLAKLEPKSGVFARSKQSKKKDVGLGLLFKMGTARSGNWGHAGRPGKVGGSADSNNNSKPKKGDKFLLPDGTVCEYTGFTQQRGGLTLHRVLIRWTAEQIKIRREAGIREIGEGHEYYMPEDQLRRIPKKKSLLDFVQKIGTATSGNHGHVGRPGKVGGSGEGIGKDFLLTPGVHTREDAKKLVTYLETTLPDAEFAIMGSLASSKEESLNDIDIAIRPKAMTEDEYYAFLKEDDKRREELGSAYYDENISGPYDDLKRAMNRLGFIKKKVMKADHNTPIQWKDTYIERYVRKKTKHSVDFWFFERAEPQSKNIGLATIFKMGTARSGNWGHTSRSRDEANARGGSDPKNGSKRKGERANIVVTEAEKAKHKIQDAKKAKQLGLRHAKRLKDGTLVWDDGTKVPKELLENLTAGIPPGLEDIYINPDKQSILDGNYAVRARSATTGGITGIYNKDAIAENTDGKWAKVRKLEREESNLTRQILRDNKYGEFLDLEDNSACLRLIQVSAIRAGDENDTKYGVYGACTLLGKHVTIKGNTAYLDFTAKHSVKQRIVVKDKFLVSDLKTRKARVGANGSLYETNYHSKYGLLNYTKSLSKNNYTPKDFRSLRATQWALDEMSSVAMPTTKKEYAAAIKKVCAPVGALLGHVSSTGEAWSMAYNKYVDPRIFADWKKSAGV